MKQIITITIDDGTVTDIEVKTDKNIKAKMKEIEKKLSHLDFANLIEDTDHFIIPKLNGENYFEIQYTDNSREEFEKIIFLYDTCMEDDTYYVGEEVDEGSQLFKSLKEYAELYDKLHTLI